MEINKNELWWLVHSLDTAYRQALGNNDTEVMRNYEDIHAKMSHLLGRMFREEMDTISISW